MQIKAIATSNLSEWLLSKRQQVAIFDLDVEKSEPSCTFGGTVNWCGHFVKHYEGS